MLYEELNVGTVVCLSCGAKIGVDKLTVVDVADTVAPEDIKAKGAFFQTVACPQCKKGVYFGFLVDLESAFNNDDDAEDTAEDEFVENVAAEATESSGQLRRKEDGTIILDEDELPDEVVAAERRIEEARKKAGVKTSKKKKKKKKKAKKSAATKPAGPHKPNRTPSQKGQCTICGEMFNTRDVAMGAFGSRCDKCMRQLKSKCG